jgi:hypothetical protein
MAFSKTSMSLRGLIESQISQCEIKSFAMSRSVAATGRHERSHGNADIDSTTDNHDNVLRYEPDGKTALRSKVTLDTISHF